MNEDRTPVLIGVAQLVQRDVDPAVALGPLEMMVETARRAAADAGGDGALLRAVDTVAVVNIISTQYANAPRLLAEALGAHPARELYTTMSGSSPQALVNHAAAGIAAGRVRLALLSGAEAFATLRRARTAGVETRWSSDRGRGAPEPTPFGEHRPGTSPHELAHGFQMPVQIYPLFENALRAQAGRSVAAHQAYLGRLCAHLAATAARNPYAWFPTARPAAEIATPTPTNRVVGFPYTKYMNAIMDVDQSASLLVASVAQARALGLPEDRWIYPWASADAVDRWFISERESYHTSPAIRVAAERALGTAGVSVHEIAYLDLYSCFPAAVQLARDMLGIEESDERPLSVTGGLPYAGGPGSNYAMHAIATMVERLRHDCEALGLVSALGWYVTKHAIGLYGAAPPRRPWRAHEYDDAGRADACVPELVTEPAGPARIEAYTVMHDRDGTPVRGLVVGRLGRDAGGPRFLANTPPDRSVLEGLMAREGVGQPGRVSAGDGVNLFDPR